MASLSGFEPVTYGLESQPVKVSRKFIQFYLNLFRLIFVKNQMVNFY